MEETAKKEDVIVLDRGVEDPSLSMMACCKPGPTPR